MSPSRLRRKGLVSLAVSATALATAMATVSTAQAAPSGQADRIPVEAFEFTGDTAKIEGLPDRATGRVAVYVQFAGAGAAQVAQTAGAGAGQTRATAVERQAQSVEAAAQAADSKAEELYVTTNALPGIALLLNQKAIRAIAERDDVVKVSRIVPKTAHNANVVSFIKAAKTWQQTGGTGRGVRVAVIDTGLDYTHADFGGEGTPEAYEAEDPTNRRWVQELSKIGRAKIAGGFDFAGDAYNADPDSPDYSPIPSPDPNPLDCEGHGTHVAGTTLGYGVTAAGKTFVGDYAKLDAGKLMKMRVGPGVAPAAKVYGYKVFGCDGSTNLVGQALDRALDPNGDGFFDDAVDIINMSLGSDYSPVDDPENALIDELTKYGVLTVASNGNAGDLTDVGGSPGNAISALAVASSVDAYQLLDGIEVNAPSSVAGQYAGQTSIAYDWTSEPVTGDVVTLSDDNADGCSPLSPADEEAVAGKVAWLTWDSNDSTRACGSAARGANVANAGAVGAIFTGDVSPFGAGISGVAEIPILQLTKSATGDLQAAAEAGELNVTFDGELVGAVQEMDPSIVDNISSFTSRGDHGSIGSVKPDVAAPGDSIASAGVGTGSRAAVNSGTSMASPNAAGVAALIKGKRPGWGPLQLKAAVVNNARHDLFNGPDRTGDRYAPARVGTGRVDAKATFSAKHLAYVQKGTAVSATFGVVPAPITGGTVTKTRTVKVQNASKKTTTYKLSYEAVNAAAGVSYSVSPKKVTVKPGKTKAVTVTMKVKPGALRKQLDPTMEETQAGLPRQFVSDASGRLLVQPGSATPLRVAVYGAAKPVSETSAAVADGQVDLSGTGVSQGSGTEAYESIVSVMTLGAESEKLPQCPAGVSFGDGTCVAGVTERGGDLKAVGAGATDDFLWFGVATHGDWARVGNAITPYVDYDVDGDEEPDYETWVQNYPDTDVLLAITADLDTGDLVDLQPVNFLFADEADTNVFDTNVILMPVSKSELANVGSKPLTDELTYGVGMESGSTGGDIDWVDAEDAFNPVDPAFSVDGEVFADQGGTSVEYSYSGDEPTKALVFHLHGARKARDQVLEIPAAEPAPATP